MSGASPKAPRRPTITAIRAGGRRPRRRRRSGTASSSTAVDGDALGPRTIGPMAELAPLWSVAGAATTTSWPWSATRTRRARPRVRVRTIPSSLVTRTRTRTRPRPAALRLLLGDAEIPLEDQVLPLGVARPPARGCGGTAGRAGAAAPAGPGPAGGTPRSPSGRRSRTAPPSGAPPGRGRRSGRGPGRLGVGLRALRGPATWVETTGASPLAERAVSRGSTVAGHVLVAPLPRHVDLVARLVRRGRRCIRSSADVMSLPPNLVMTSPGLRAAPSAPEPGADVGARPRPWRRRRPEALLGCPDVTRDRGHTQEGRRLDGPPLPACRPSAMGLTVSMAMAKPMFWASSPWRARMTAVFMPITSPAAFDQRSARVARVDGRVGLDEVLESAPIAVGDRAVERRHDALGHRRAAGQGEGVADGHDVVADLQLVADPRASPWAGRWRCWILTRATSASASLPRARRRGRAASRGTASP